MGKWMVLVMALFLREGSAAPTASTTEIATETIAVAENSTSPVSLTTRRPPPVTTEVSTPSGDRCVLESDCGDADLYCEEGRCACRDLLAVLSPENLCIPARRLGEECQFDSQCKAGDGDVSTCAHGVCACHQGLFFMQDQNGTSCVIGKDSPQPRVPKPHIDPNMIIIMAVLAIMFVGMCLALHLFSRSRFRNNRTIFNSPHPRLMHIKLGKKKKGHRRGSSTLHVPASRQPSICSQRSGAGSPGTGSRRGSRVDSQETLKGPHPPPNALNGQLGAPIAQLEETSPTTEDLKKDPWKSPGPDVVKEASVVQNGPNSPTIIVTHTSNGSRSPSTVAETTPSPIARV